MMFGLTLPFVATFCALILMSLYPRQVHTFALRLFSRLPDKVVSIMDGLLTKALEGIAPLRNPQTLATVFGLSIPVWLAEAAVFWLMGHSFGIERYHEGPLPMAVNMVFTTALTNLGGSIPAAPGGLRLVLDCARYEV